MVTLEQAKDAVNQMLRIFKQFNLSLKRTNLQLGGAVPAATPPLFPSAPSAEKGQLKEFLEQAVKIAEKGGKSQSHTSRVELVTLLKAGNMNVLKAFQGDGQVTFVRECFRECLLFM